MISPTAPRNPKAYDDATNVVATPGPIDTSIFDSITVSNDTTSLTITHPAQIFPPDQTDGQSHHLTRLKPGESLEGTNATFSLLAFRAGYLAYSTFPAAGLGSIPLALFSPDGKPISTAQEAQLGIRARDLGVSASERNLPVLLLVFGETNRPPGNYSPVALFDTRTRRQLTSGSSWSQVGRTYPGKLELHPQLWHATPMELVLDVDLDGKVTQDVEIAPRTRIVVPGGEVLLLGIWDGEVASSSSSSGGGNSPETMKAQLKMDADKPRSVAATVMAPRKLAIHFEFLNAEKRMIIGGGGGGSFGTSRLTGIGTNAAAVKWLRWTVYTNHHRVIIPLPPLPNLPPENQNVTDLLQVRIPSVHFSQEYELRQFLGNVTQMNFDYSLTNVIPVQSFPLNFTNTTPAEMLATYRRWLPSGHTFVIDASKNEIRVELTKPMKAWFWIKQKLGLR